VKNIAHMIAAAGALSTPSVAYAHVSHIGLEKISHMTAHIVELFFMLSACVVTIYFIRHTKNRTNRPHHKFTRCIDEFFIRLRG